MQAQIAFEKNNPSSILNLKVGSQRYKKILCNHLQFVKYFVIFYTLSLQSDSHFPWMVLLPDEVLWSHLALPEKPRWSHLYNLGSVISMSTKSDPKYASFEFSSLQNKGVLCCERFHHFEDNSKAGFTSRPSPNLSHILLLLANRLPHFVRQCVGRTSVSILIASLKSQIVSKIYIV